MTGSSKGLVIPFFLLALLSLISQPCRGQWRSILSYPIGPSENIRAIYFLDRLGYPNIGFAAIYSHLFKTTNDGKTWKTVYLPVVGGSYAWSGDGLIDILFEDSATGWITARGYSDGYGNVLKTTDGGESWVPVLPLQAYRDGFNSVYYNKMNGGLFVSVWHLRHLGLMG